MADDGRFARGDQGELAEKVEAPRPSSGACARENRTLISATMQKRLAAVLIFSGGLLAFGLRAQSAETYKIDPVHSNIAFKVRHFLAKVSGRFAEVTGSIVINSEHPENSTVEATIQTRSISTANEKRDTHLRSPDFFEVEKYPMITFKSKKVSQLDEKTADVVGDLSMHGVTREITLHVKFLGKATGMGGVPETAWEATTSLKRSDYGLTWSKAVEGVSVVSDEVGIELDISANAPK